MSFRNATLVVLCASACNGQFQCGTETSRRPMGSSQARTATQSPASIDIAVIGDVPYDKAAIALFPALVSSINGDPTVHRVVHVGDLKSGIEQCSNARIQLSVDLFRTFTDPFIYAIGDNEWSDCHRASNGGYNPLDRLALIRSLLYPVPGKVFGGGNLSVEAQPNYPENQLWVESRVTFAVSHILGSNNGLVKWFADRVVNRVPVRETAAEAASREAEVADRQAANIAWLEHTFATAKAEQSRGIVLFFQADLWHPFDRALGGAFTAHQTWVDRFAQLASPFPGKILLIVGDSHDYRIDAGVPWMTAHYGKPALPNVTQIVVDSSIESPTMDLRTPSVIEWLRLRVDPQSAEVFSWEQVIVPES